jgi:DNA-binding transcriptional regulator YiaG
MIHFGLRVTDRMRELGLTPNALAVDIGVPTATLRNWMGGNSIPADWRLIKLCKALRINQTKLLLGV